MRQRCEGRGSWTDKSRGPEQLQGNSAPAKQPWGIAPSFVLENLHLKIYLNTPFWIIT